MFKVLPVLLSLSREKIGLDLKTRPKKTDDAPHNTGQA
jgi:hypothetical protein